MERKSRKMDVAAKSKLIQTLEQLLPPMLMRNKWPEYSEKYGLPFTRETMQDRDSAGTGPEYVLIGRHVAYTRESYLTWLRSRMGA